MKRITIDGETGVSIWDNESDLIGFRPDGSSDWTYYLRPQPPPPPRGWRTDYEEAE